MPGLRRFLASALLVSSFAACDGDVLVGEFVVEPATNGGTGGTTASVSTTTSGGGSAGASDCIPRSCQNGPPYECGNCKDDDVDGLVDAEDPDCLGPCQNSEKSYYGDIPGQSGGNCERDCHFDQNAGAGDDDCHWDHSCDSREPNPECAYDPEMSCAEFSEPPSQECLDTCLPLVPNGCDCFGCCEVPGGTAVWLGSEVDGQGSCKLEYLADPERCRPCTPVYTCFNPCDNCEVCVGKPVPPPECGGNGETPQDCPEATEGCGLTGQSGCSAEAYCITGCCIITVK